MRTEAQNRASRENGAKSQGPKTPEGKAVSSQNALRHGMTARGVILTNEDPELFCRLAQAYYDKFQPADDVERDLVDEMVISKWRQRRDWSNEAALLDLEMDHQTGQVDHDYKKIDHACRFALAFRALADESHALELASRYETAHRRAYYKALSALLHLRAQTTPPPPAPAPEDKVQHPEPVTDVSPSPAPSPSSEKKICETNLGPAEPAPAGDNPPIPGTNIGPTPTNTESS